MKFTLKSLIAGSVATIAGLSMGLILATNPTVYAQSASPTETSPALFPEFLQQLNLSPEQESQLAQLRQTTREQLQQILTESQREQFRATMEQGGTLRQAIAAMNLSSDQQTQLRSLMQSSRDQALTILTPEQQEQIRTQMRSRWQERGGHQAE